MSSLLPENRFCSGRGSPDRTSRDLVRMLSEANSGMMKAMNGCQKRSRMVVSTTATPPKYQTVSLPQPTQSTLVMYASYSAKMMPAMNSVYSRGLLKRYTTHASTIVCSPYSGMVMIRDQTREVARAPGSKLCIIEEPLMISAKKNEIRDINTQEKYRPHLEGVPSISLDHVVQKLNSCCYIVHAEFHESAGIRAVGRARDAA